MEKYEISTKLEKLSLTYMKLLERTQNSIEKIHLFEAYYKTLLLIEQLKYEELQQKISI